MDISTEYIGLLTIPGQFTLYVKEIVKGEPEYLIIDCFINGKKIGRTIKYRIYYNKNQSGYIKKNGVNYFMSEFKFNSVYLSSLYK